MGSIARGAIVVAASVVATAGALACNEVFGIERGNFVPDAEVVSAGGDGGAPVDDAGGTGDGSGPLDEAPVVVLADAGAAASGATLLVNDTTAFVVTDKGIGRVPLSGAEALEPVHATNDRIVAAALATSYIYFFDEPAGDKKLFRCGLDGSNVTLVNTPYLPTQLVAAGEQALYGTVTADGGNIYTNGGSNTGPGQVFVAEPAVVLFASGSSLLWAAYGDIRGTSVDNVAPTTVASPGGIVSKVAAGGGQLVFYTSSTVYRIALADGVRVPVISLPGVPKRLAVVPQGIYFLKEAELLQRCPISASPCPEAHEIVAAQPAIDFGVNATHVVWLQYNGALMKKHLPP